MKKVPAPKIVTTLEAPESPLPAEVQEALGELVGAAREGLLALSVGVGLGVVHELMELEVTEVVGLKGKRNPERTAKRHGHEDGSMTLGGWRVAVRRPRVRTADDEHELPVKTYEYFADRDALTRAVMGRMLAGVSTRKFAAVGEPVGLGVATSSTATSKTSVSRCSSSAPRPRSLSSCVAPTRRRSPGGDDARRDAGRRRDARRRARHQHGGRQDPARAVGRQHRERDARAHAARRSRRSWPRSPSGRSCS